MYDELSKYGPMALVVGILLAFLLTLFKSQTLSLVKTIESKDEEIKRLNDLRAETGETVATAIVANENAMVEFRRVLAAHTETIKDLKTKIGDSS